MIVLILCILAGLAWAAKRLADEKVESVQADWVARQAEFNAHADEAIALLDPPVPLAWPAGVVPLRVDADVFRAHHDRRGGAR